MDIFHNCDFKIIVYYNYFPCNSKTIEVIGLKQILKIALIVMSTNNAWLLYEYLHGTTNSSPYMFWYWSTIRSEHAISLYGHTNRSFLVIFWLEIENNELMVVIPLKIRFTVLPELLKQWHFILTLETWKRLS